VEPRSQKILLWTKWVFLITGLALIVIGLTISLIYNVILAPCTEEQSFIKTAPEFPVFGQECDIDTSLFQPKAEYNFYSEGRPAVVLVSGFMSSKVYFRGLAYELTRRGFVCLTLTPNGHSSSGEAYTFTWENVTLSAVKYLRDASTRLKIDTHRIGLVGHSMGSFSVTLAAIIDQERRDFWINATVGIGGPVFNITSGSSEFDHLYSNAYIYPNHWYDPKVALANAVIAGRTNASRPYNYLNIIGSNDEMFSQKSAYELIYGMSSSPPGFWAAYNITTYSAIVPSRLYGDFSAGTARKLVIVPGVDHLLEGHSKATIINVINWFEVAMKLNATRNYPGVLIENYITEEIRTQAPIVTSIGALILFIPLIIYFGQWLKPDMKLPKNAMQMPKKDKRYMILLYAGIYISISFLSILVIDGLHLSDTIGTDFYGSNLLSLPILVQGLLLLPILLLLMWYEKRTYNLRLTDFGIELSIKPYILALTYGFLLFGMLYLVFNLGVTAVIQNFAILHPYAFVKLFLYLFVGFLIFETFFRGLLQNKLYQSHGPAWKEVLKAGLLTGFIEGLGLSIMIVGLLSLSGFDVFYQNIGGLASQNIIHTLENSLPLFIFIPLIVILIEINFAILKAGIFRKINRNIMASSVLIALFLAWLIAALLPYISLYAPRYVFMT